MRSSTWYGAVVALCTARAPPRRGQGDPCHLQECVTDGRELSPGSTGQLTPRNAQGLANVAWHATYTRANPTLVTLERLGAGRRYSSLRRR